MDHSIQKCSKFLKMVQVMMNDGEIEFYGKVEEQNVSVLLEEVRKPVTIFYREEGQQATKVTPHVPTPRLVVEVPAPFRYTNDKTVSWNYMSQAVVKDRRRLQNKN